MSNSRPVSISLYDMTNGAVSSGTVQYIFRGAIEGNVIHPAGTTSVTVTSGTATTTLATSAIGNSFPYDLVVTDGLDYSFLLPYGDGGTVNVATLITATNNPPAQNIYEPALGNPGTSGHVLSSTTAGVRSWVAQSGGGGAVSSVFGRTGAVVAAASDYAASEIEDDSTMAKASVAAALNTLDTSITNLSNNKQDADADLTAIAGLSPSNDDIIQRKAGAWTNRTMPQLLSDVGALPQDAGIVAVSSGRDLASTDAGKILECNGTFTVTCPNGLDAGFQCVIVNVGSGTITLAAATTLQSDGTQIATQYTGATVYHRGSNVWLAMGKLTS